MVTFLVSSSFLRGIATVSFYRSLNRRVPGPHRPYEGLQRVVVRQRRIGATRPHRPYEGLQPARHALNQPVELQSSSSLRGIATEVVLRFVSTGSGPHRPYEGLQHATIDKSAPTGTGPHRPYEGLQHQVVRDLPGIAGAVLIVPTRDCNCLTTSVDGTTIKSSSSLRGIATRHARPLPARLAGPHRPYEGLQRVEIGAALVGVDVLSSSSLRGIATSLR